MARRRFLAQLATWPLAALIPITTFPEQRSASRKIVLKSAWGSDDPTKAAFPFSHANALSEAGHEVQIFLLGEAVGLMRRSLEREVRQPPDLRLAGGVGRPHHHRVGGAR
ncbi:MAG TPA: hypothetical protein VFT28_14235 [Gemmatimonadales bacterium]|nr:hypothetical protein [Gemmatimonadales bacterium]